MQKVGTALRFSPSDINDFVACTNIVHFKRAVVEGLLRQPETQNPGADLLAQKGDEHERAYLRRLHSEGLAIVEIGRMPIENAAGATEDAMRKGAGIVYQAAFLHGDWQGHADFLVRVDRPSSLGNWSYEVADTKLARHAKPYFLLQLSFYSEQLARLQGFEPRDMHVVLGTGERQTFQCRDFSAYSRRVRSRFEREVSEGQPGYPCPCDHCGLCDFSELCEARWSADDHISMVANIRREQINRFGELGVTTVQGLAEADPALKVRIGPATLDSLRDQAALQSHHRRTGEHKYRLLPPELDRGFALLPKPSEGDVYFDMEGDPYFEAGAGLEYLFGVMFVEEGRPRYRSFWGHDRHGEKVAFEAFIDFVQDRRGQYPDLHVYHYAHYEPTAVKRLMGAHGTREEEVDDLLRGGVFVDLFRVVRQALRISHPSYSIKKVRTFFMDEPAGGSVLDAEDSVVAYEQWLDSEDQKLLDAIAEYNELDCLSTLALRDWLVERRAEAEHSFGVKIGWKTPPERKELEPETLDALDAQNRLKADLLKGVPEDLTEAEPESRARWLLAQLLDYHRREDKPVWWAYFDRLQATDEELIEDMEAIAGLEPAPGVPPRPDKRSFIHTLRFPEQEHKLKPGQQVDPRTQKTINLVDVDDSTGTLRIRVGPSQQGEPLPTAIVAGGPLNKSAQRAALGRLGTHVATHGLDGPGRYRAIREVLLRETPRITGRQRGEQIQTRDIEEMHDIVANLDGSHLFIQGPPGSGKTWTGARLIVDLIRRGKRVGVAATSHKAIHNLLKETEEAAAEKGVIFKGLKKCTDRTEETQYLGSSSIANSSRTEDFGAPAAAVRLLAGTAWLFAREEMDATLDYLFLDEAGQISLADALAMGTAAQNLILLGDPLQLAQVSQGVHPGNAGASVLEHLLGEDATIPVDRGLFLAETRRLHPKICGFISEVVYENRLRSWEGCARRKIEVSGKAEIGIRHLPVEHVGNGQRSVEEAVVIKSEMDRLLKDGYYTDEDGATHRMTPADIMVVAPYNVQVRCLRDTLGSAIEVGTVDKFQGREAPAVFFSMTTSSGDDLPRNLEFLFSRNRLNVAVSRAQCLAVVVASPRLLDVQCRTVEQMRMVNALCRLVEVAEDQQVGAASAARLTP